MLGSKHANQSLRRTVLRRVLAQAQIQRVLDEARRHHIIGSTHVSCNAAAILRCASNAGRAHLYYLHKSSSKCNQTSTSRGRTSQSCTTREPKYYYSRTTLIPSPTKQQNAEFGTSTFLFKSATYSSPHGVHVSRWHTGTLRHHFSGIMGPLLLLYDVHYCCASGCPSSTTPSLATMG